MSAYQYKLTNIKHLDKCNFLAGVHAISRNAFFQDKEKIINRNNIYSRQFLAPSRSCGNLGLGSVSAGNSVSSILVTAAPSGSDVVKLRFFGTD
jgi:hypothetical protein